MDQNEDQIKCLNCGEILNGSFCTHCGQKHQPIRPFVSILKESFNNFSLIDNRIFHSVKYLLFKPGFLTNEYIAGRRKRYSSPLKMYLLVSAIYFAVLTLTDTNTFFGSLTIAESASEGLKVWLPRLMFCLMPILALFLKFLFLKKNRYYYEHLIFSLHYYSFYFLTVIGIALIRYYSGISLPDIRETHWWIVVPDSTLQFLPFLYLIISLKKVYRLKTWWAILSALIILIFLFLILISAGDIAERIW